jgi:putative cardiolipin synthase
MLLKIGWLARSGMVLRAFDGSPVEGQSSHDGRWGLHSKRAVIDGKTVLVGTYNIDPRSANLNSELMVVCRNQPELAAAFIADIEARASHSKVALHDGDWHLDPILGGASRLQLLLTLVSLPLANLFDFLL